MTQLHIVKWVRRSHLYAGLFLAPWVLVYGLSAGVINHPDWFSDDSADLRQWTVEPTAATHRLDAGTLAREVVAALNETARADGAASEWQLSAESPPQFGGEILVEGKDEGGRSVLLLLPPAGERGRTFRRQPDIVATTIELSSVGDELLRAVQDQIAAAATAAEPELSSVRFNDAQFPALALQLEHNGERRSASYDVRSGALTLNPPSTVGSLSATQFLKGLHFSHGYPRDGRAMGVRTVRAVFVDAMACLLCFWTLSGLAMWWQLKVVRRSGLVVIVAALLVAGLVWSGMHRYFVSGA
jgi:hypothetical protein